MPLAALLVFGFVLATDVKGLALGVIDADSTAASRRLVAELAAKGTFDPAPVRDAVRRSIAPWSPATSARRWSIPPDFDRDLRRSRDGMSARRCR